MRDSMQMARCLSRCTPKSLILMDEFGKGTDVIDGPALLSACIRYLSGKGADSPRAVLATHLTETFRDNMVKFPFPVQFNHMKVVVSEDDSDKITYLYDVGDGMTDGSFGITCAKNAGVKEDVIARAKFFRDLLIKGGDGDTIIELMSIQRDADSLVVKRASSVVKRFLSWDLETAADASKVKADLLRLLG
ncbi:unnamed protein product [Ambrosiozyma monospora]|uniref:Unnamed protein product n=1 Tax=Ambrosiozyma monospora TaxID=43982 RepID=A0ACB5TBN3_AMBMO|nr:unnamed protein product [Ambrosiozyma monospora]